MAANVPDAAVEGGAALAAAATHAIAVATAFVRRTTGC